MSGRAALPLSVAVLLALVLALHGTVLTRGDLITPAGMHYAQWPWKALAPEIVARKVTLQENPALSDLLFQVHPWQVHVSRSLGWGALPLWNPYSSCGAPFVANAQSAVFFPLHWPVWLVPSVRMFTLALMAKVVLAGALMAVFLRGLGLSAAACVTGSVSFALSGFMTSWLGYAHTNAALWLPILMHAARRLADSPGARPFLILSGSSAAQYLGGHPETSLHIVGAASLYFLWCLRGAGRPRLSLLLYAAAGLLGFAMAAVQMLPFVEYLWSSAALVERQALPGLDPALPPSAPMALIAPYQFGRPWTFDFVAPVPFQAMAGYAGAGVLVLALTTLGTRAGPAPFFQLLALVSAAVVYGPAWVRSLLRPVPVVGISSNNRLLLVLGFCLAALAALAVHRLGADRRPPSPGGTLGELGRAGRPALCAAGLMLLAIALPASRVQDSRAALGLLAAAGALCATAELRQARRGIYAAGLAGLTCADLYLFALGFNPHADPKALFPSTPLIDFVRQESWADQTRGGRIMTVGWAMRPETHMVHRLSSIEGYDAMDLVRHRRLLERAGVAEIHRSGVVPEASRPLLDLMGLRFIVTPPDVVVAGADLELSYEGPDGRVFVNPTALPRFLFVDRAVGPPSTPPAGGAEEARAVLDLMASARLDPRRVVVLEPAPPGRGSEVPPEDRPVPQGPPAVVVERNLPGDLEVSVRAPGRPGWLVVLEAYDGGWRARVDGSAAPVLRADYAFMAVPVPASGAAVSLAYSPTSFRLGAWISVISLLGALGLGLAHMGRLKAPPRV